MTLDQTISDKFKSAINNGDDDDDDYDHDHDENKAKYFRLHQYITMYHLPFHLK